MNSLLSEMSAGAAQVASQLGLVGLSETDIARAWKYSMADTCGHTLHVGDTLHYSLLPRATQNLSAHDASKQCEHLAISAEGYETA